LTGAKAAEKDKWQEKTRKQPTLKQNSLLSDFEQAVVLKTLDFNLQPKLVQSAKESR
jgi:hypothetical protein